MLSLLFLLAGAGYAHASCFGKDAGFNPANGKPVVSQPSRNDPSKVLVDWSTIVKNPDCVDSFTLLVWPDGMPPTSAVRHQVEKTLKSKIVDIKPCVGYRFAVETNEKNTLGTKTAQSGDQLFKTAGTSATISLESSRISVTYVWDPVQKITDLRMAVISIPQELLPGASCLDYIQVTGSQVRSVAKSAVPASARSRTFSSWAHLGQNTFNPNIQVGGAATLPASLGGTSYKDAVAQGPASNTRSSAGNTPPASPAQPLPAPLAVQPITSPYFSNLLPRQTGGAVHQVGPVKIQPPFLNNQIEIRVAVQDCAEYDFEIKFFAPGSKEVGKISQVKLPALAEVPGYIPPPLTSVMSISYGVNGKPVYGVKTTSGVNAACLPAYFEAFDAYNHRLENEVYWLNREGHRVNGLVTNSQVQLEKSQEELLRKTGCVCISPYLQFSSVDSAHQKKYGNQFGLYKFQGMHAGKPFYQLSDKPLSTVPLTPTTVKPGVTTQPTTTTSKPAVVTPIYLFWEEKKKQWIFSPTLGSTSSVEFGSVESSLAVCPGDPPAASNWQYKSSILGRWTKSADVKVSCEVPRH